MTEPSESARVYQVSLLVYTIVQGVWGLGEIIWMSLKLEDLNDVLYPKSDINTTTTTTTMATASSTETTDEFFYTSSTPTSNNVSSHSVFSDVGLTCDELIDVGILRSYYILALAITVIFLVLTSLLIYALKIKSKSLLKSFLDIDSSLTLILLLIYILTLSHGFNYFDKEFFALYGFFIAFRLFGLYLTCKTYAEFSKDHVNFPRVEFRANGNGIDSISASTTTLHPLHQL